MEKGLYKKYIIQKANGEPIGNDFKFVLSPEKDVASLEALKRFAETTENKSLKNDIENAINEILSQKNFLTQEEKLEIINSMEVIDTDADGDGLIYVLVDYNDENLEKLAKVVPNVEEYLKNHGDPDGFKEDIDISIAAFENAGADFFEKGKFVIYTKDELIDMYCEEKNNRKALDKKLKDYKKQLIKAKYEINKILTEVAN